MDEIRKIPPVTRFLCGSSLAVTLPVMLNIASPYKLIFVKQLVTQRFEVSTPRFAQSSDSHPLCLDMENIHELLPWRYVCVWLSLMAQLTRKPGSGLNYLFDFVML